jgi:hypothetical protein
MIYLFTCVYLLNDLLISALGFTDVFICVYAAVNIMVASGGMNLYCDL